MKARILTSFPDPETNRRWIEFLGDADFATHYVTPNYFVDPYVRGERVALIADDARGRVAAVSTGVRDTRGFAAGMFSRPQTIFRRGADASGVVAAFADALAAANANVSELYTWQPIPKFADHGFSVRESSEATSVVMLDLSRGAEALFAKFSQTRRSEIRKALREQAVEICDVESDGEVEEIYALHCDWNNRKGHQPDTIEQMRTAIAQRENRRVFVAKVEGRIVAASFYRFCRGGVVEYAANFSLPEFQRFRPNDLIGWHAIQWACEQGFSHFSMGGSHLFLRRFGGQILPTYRYRFDRSPMRLVSLQEAAKDAALGAYKRLPGGVRDGVRRVFAR